jgi:hypothetical protein
MFREGAKISTAAWCMVAVGWKPLTLHLQWTDPQRCHFHMLNNYTAVEIRKPRLYERKSEQEEANAAGNTL